MTSRRTRDRLVQRLKGQGISNQDVLSVIGNTPRHIFLDEALSHRAYEDTALPIGYGQTLSQPYIVAKMTELLIEHASSLSRVLEIGTGSGYQTVVLAQLVENVLSVERIRPLQEKARQRLRVLGLRNVILKHADGALGWPEDGLFNAILSAAAPTEIPPALKNQLAPDGILICPVGGEVQALKLVKRVGDSADFTVEDLEPVKFVPLLSGVTR